MAPSDKKRKAPVKEEKIESARHVQESLAREKVRSDGPPFLPAHRLPGLVAPLPSSDACALRPWMRVPCR